jgi:hypothetical protein
MTKVTLCRLFYRPICPYPCPYPWLYPYLHTPLHYAHCGLPPVTIAGVGRVAAKAGSVGRAAVVAAAVPAVVAAVPRTAVPSVAVAAMHLLGPAHVAVLRDAC